MYQNKLFYDISTLIGIVNSNSRPTSFLEEPNESCNPSNLEISALFDASWSSFLAFLR